MAFEIGKNYREILQGLKERIQRARQLTNISANTQLLKLYWEIGNTILLQQQKEGWGSKVIDRLAADLKYEFPDMKGLSLRNIKYMRAFAEVYQDFQIEQPQGAPLQSIENDSPAIVQAPPAQLQGLGNNGEKQIVQMQLAQLTWYHHTTLLDKVKDAKIRTFYIQKTIENGWSRDIMALQIENELHKRQGNTINNFNSTLSKADSDLAREMFKSPYLFDFLNLEAEIKERELENALIQHIRKFLLELGRGFAYVGKQFNINAGGDDFFLDLLFYNTRLHCYVVFELKVGEFKPEFAGKLNFYLNAIDAQIKTEEDKATIGILLCKTPNETVIEYALRGIDKPMGVADFELKKALPDKLKTELPTVEELEHEIDKEIEEFNENLNPVEARLKTIKDKLKGIKNDEIQTTSTHSVLLNLFNESLKPLYGQIIEKLTVFNDEFQDKMYQWSCANKVIVNLQQLEEFWNDQSILRNNNINFTYNWYGFKKGGTANFSTSLQLHFELSTYWYGFTLSNYNNHQPFLKKLYHQQLTPEDVNGIIDLLMNTVMDTMEFYIERINSGQV